MLVAGIDRGHCIRSKVSFSGRRFLTDAHCSVNWVVGGSTHSAVSWVRARLRIAGEAMLPFVLHTYLLTKLRAEVIDSVKCPLSRLRRCMPSWHAACRVGIYTACCAACRAANCYMVNCTLRLRPSHIPSRMLGYMRCVRRVAGMLHVALHPVCRATC